MRRVQSSPARRPGSSAAAGYGDEPAGARGTVPRAFANIPVSGHQGLHLGRWTVVGELISIDSTERDALRDRYLTGAWLLATADVVTETVALAEITVVPPASFRTELEESCDA